MELIKKLIFLIWVINLSAQNLIKNGSFEDYKYCEDKLLIRSLIDNIYQVRYWFTPNKTTPDFYSACYKYGEFAVPKNYEGEQKAKHGFAYIGIAFESNEEYEYISQRLHNPLFKDKFYCLNFFYSSAERSQLYVKNLGAIFSHKSIRTKNKKIIQKPEFGYVESSTLKHDEKNWNRATMLYKANGNEKHLTIGYFDDAYTSKLSKKKILKYNYAYYYIDDISLTLIDDSTKCDCKTKTISSIDSLQTVSNVQILDTAKLSYTIIENLVFESDKSEILSVSYTSLDEILVLLNKQANISIQLLGHTDNVGKEEDNLILSEERAKAVANYLIAKGIDPKRIDAKGYGSTKPLFPNDSEENREKNRRVEFIIK